MAATTLNGAIDDVTTSVIVVSAVGFPTVPFRILVESELMLVTDVTGETFTVARANLGTTGVSHSDGTAVTYVLSTEISNAGYIHY